MARPAHVPDRTAPPFLCIAHRGARGHAPENTLLSVGKALELGADWVEVDVHPVEDELVVLHDDTLDRTTDGSGPVASRGLAYVRSLDAGDGERVPLLREVMDLLDGRAGLNVELKGTGCAPLLARLLSEREGAGRLDLRRLLVSSFDHDQLRDLRAVAPRVPLGAIAPRSPDGTARFAEEVGAAVAVVGRVGLTSAFIEDAHRRRILVYVFTVNEPEEMRRVRSLGADGVFTDFPERVPAVLATGG